MGNYGSKQKKSSGCLILLILLAVGALGYTGYRYFADASLYNSAGEAFQSGDLESAYKDYGQIDRSFHLFDPGNYLKNARLGLIACAITENNAAEALFKARNFKEAFQAFQLLRSRGDNYDIGKYPDIAAKRKLASFTAVVDSTRAAYSKGKCDIVTADGQWLIDNQVILDEDYDTSSIPGLLDNCKDFLENVENVNSSDPLTSAESIARFISDHPKDALSDIAMDKIKALATVNGYENMASLATCTLFREDEAFADRSTDPELLYSCGKTFAGASKRSEAIELLDLFIESYPEDPHNQDAVNILADLLISSAQAEGAGSLPAPDIAGNTDKGTTEYEVQNDTPYSLRVVFSGPEKRIVTIPPCPDCKEYTISPMSCPDEGPLETVALLPGNYSLLVETVSTEGVTPYTGSFELEDGTRYSSCYYVITRDS